MSPASFFSICLSLGCVVATISASDPDVSMRAGLMAIVFAILANVERRARR